MKNISILLVLLLGAFNQIKAQSESSTSPELQVAFLQDLFTYPGLKVGVHFPFSNNTKVKTKERKKWGTFTKTKFRQLKLGGNIAFYRQQNYHTGYLANVELTYQKTKNKSFKPNKIKHFETAIGLGYYRYQLEGTTFNADGEGFKEVNGNGNAFMPSLSMGWGRPLRFIKTADVRYFAKLAVYFEMPHGIGLLPHIVSELGIASPLGKKRTVAVNRLD